MARPRRCRRVCTEPDYSSFAPDGIPCGGRVTLAVEEYEVIRLIDLEKLTHEQCAKQMDISRMLTESDGLTSELVDLLIDKIYVYPDKRVDVEFKIRDSLAAHK